MLRVISQALYHQRQDNKGQWAEPDRPNPNKSIVFFVHDGKNLHVIEGFSGDSHLSIGFPNAGEWLIVGRFVRETNKAAANVDPDLVTTPLLQDMVFDIQKEFGDVQLKLEWFGSWYTYPELLQEFEHSAYH